MTFDTTATIVSKVSPSWLTPHDKIGVGLWEISAIGYAIASHARMLQLFCLGEVR